MNITIAAVNFSYPGGVTALAGVSLQVESGEAVAIVGENGAGKTTLVKHINGLLRPNRGRVTVGDWDTAGHTVAELAGRVGYVFQNPDDQLFERTVRRELAFGPRNLGRNQAEARASIDMALTRTGLESLAETHPYDLSFAQRKWVALASVLAMQTPIVILDEPTAGQDGRGIAALGRLVEDLKAEGRTLVAISHDLDFVADHFPRLVVMADGGILADGPAAQVLAQTDLLRRAQVDPPQLVRLAAALGLPGLPTGVEPFLAAVREKAGG
jgi:energy-coupling factor transport system ATP-binding protein